MMPVGRAFIAECADDQIVNMPKITHGHVIRIAPVAGSGLFGSPAWQEAQSEDEFEVVVYNSLTVDPESKSLLRRRSDVLSKRSGRDFAS